MQFTGKIKGILPQVTGESANGSWIKQPFVIEIQNGNKMDMLALDAWGDQANTVASLPLETEVTADVNIKSREYNGKWYTEIKAWKIEVKGGIKAPTQYATAPSAPPQQSVNQDDNQDLPF